KTVSSIEGLAFEEIDLSTANYLILTHPDLRRADSVANADPVVDYATYRRSEAGGSYDAVVANIQEVYDQFGYGVPTPLAVRNMVQMGFETGNLRSMFIVGRGRTVNSDFYRQRDVEHFVPTYGTPGSDMLFGVFEGSLLPRIGIGRLTAISAEEVRAYLNKIAEHEAVPYDALWRKNMIQLSGGQNAFELSRFRGYVSNYAEIAEEDFLGGRSATLSKETTANVEFLNIREEVNRGVGMITFFGHSGPAITDIEVDPADRFNNKGRYPSVFLVNGCNAGEIFASARSFGENWVTLGDKGSTNFIAHTDLALSTSLNTYSRLFYEVAYGDSTTFASTLGGIMVEVGSRYLGASTSTSAQAQVYPMLLQGDPANTAFGANSPDYEINDGSVRATSLQGNEVLASQDSFRVEVIVQNFGRTTFDSLDISINQTLPSGRVVSVSKTFDRVLYADTLEMFVPIDVTDGVTGSNTLEVLLDPQGQISELDETNNRVSMDLFISSGNTVQLFPIDQGIVSESNVSLIWQPFGSSAERSYELQIDTVATYSSPYFVTGNESGAVLLTRSLDLSGLPDSTTIFWRSRFAEPSEDEDTVWTESTFTYLPQDTTGGWGQFAIEQRLTSTLEGTIYNETTDQWEFEETSNAIRIDVYGPDNTELAYEDITVLVNDIDLITTANRVDPVCLDNTFNAIAFDRQSSNPYFPIQFNSQPVANRLICGRAPQFIHNFNETDLIGDDRWMSQLIDNMDDGDQIVLFTIGENTFSNWDATLLDKLAEVGIDAPTIEGLTDGQPAIFFGTKGAAAGTATTVTGNATGFPIREQFLTFNGEARGRFTEGRLITQTIGPATKWWQLDYSLTEDASDDVTINVIGITPAGQEVVQFTEGRTDDLDISTIDAEQYPNLRIEANYEDEIALTPPQINYWRLYYETPPDGILLNPSDGPIQLLQEGDSLRTSFGFYNYSNTDFADSVNMTALFRDGESGAEFMASTQLQGPAAGDTITFEIEEPTVGRVGEYGLRTRVQPEEPELYAVNNAANLSQFARVEPDRVNPVLDVTFDGAYILNGDLVSPTPLINILIKDQNTVLTKTDTTGITVSLRSGDEGTFERIPFSDPQINWTPATDQEDFTIQYEPGPLADNRYGLRVEATDGSGNAAGSDPYEITFEVVNESSITRFFPYPNPFSTSTRFVFTLTGAEVPDQIKIQIMTVSGRVVREILQDEIGPIRIGNNITQYAWDGRDEFGDQLANGVYLYRVITNINGEQVKNRGTAADQAFKHGYGKLYLLR
ncbi:MAG: C25 family cysteine peptidase, partial [Bacteroidota bacterium]